jgi:voltage-gated potassium channel Kch
LKAERGKRFQPNLKVFRKKLIHWLKKCQWLIVGCLALITIYLGYIGFKNYYGPKAEGRTAWDFFYLSLQLFLLDSGSVPGPKCWQLELARFLAPLLATYTAVKVLMTIFWKQVRFFRLMFIKNHIVVCGLGRKGFLSAKMFRKEGYLVVAIEKNENCEFLEECEEEGIITIIGDAADRSVLRKAQVEKARYLLSTCGDDATNLEIAAHCFELSDNRKAEGPLTCFAHIVDPQLCRQLIEYEIFMEKPNIFQLEFFNIYEMGARFLLQDLPPLKEEAFSPGHQPHILIVGFGRMGQFLLVHLVKQLRGKLKSSGKKLLITIIDREAERKTKMMSLQYPRLEEFCLFNNLNVDIRTPEYQEKLNSLFSPSNKQSVDIIYICLGDNSTAIFSALSLFQKVANKNIPIVIRLTQGIGLTVIVREMIENISDFKNIHTFDLFNRTCRPELVLGGVHEIIARALHQYNIRNKDKIPMSDELNSSFSNWEELPDAVKNSYRNQAYHIGLKLKSVGCGIIALTNWENEPFQFTSEEIEILAKIEHEHWMENHIAQGWSYAPGQKNLTIKTHPLLVPWSELPEEIKERYRNFISELPGILAQADLQIFRYKKTQSKEG